MKTLLVQDHANQTLLIQFLAVRGYEVAICGSAIEARKRWTLDQYPLIALDLSNLAEGEAFCRWLAAQPGRNGRFVLASIPASDSDLASRFLDAGADDVVADLRNLAALGVRLASVEHQMRQRFDWERKTDTLNTRAHQQVAIAALSQCALSHDLSVLTDLTHEFVMRLLEVEYCALIEVCEDPQQLKCNSGFGWRPGEVLPLPPGDSLTGRTLKGEHFLVNDLGRDSRFPEPDFLRERGIVSAISVAVKGDEDGMFRVLGAYSDRKREFTEDELRFLEGLANVLGAAAERQRIEEEIQKHQSQVQHLQRLESVGQLAAGLAHDYNNVLTVIHGHVTLSLAEPGLPPGVADSLTTVLEAVERAAELTRHLLSFSRKQTMELNPVDLNSVVVSVAKLLGRVLGSNIRLNVSPFTCLPAIEADTGMLDQVLLNLAVNARDAMPSGGRLLISTSLEKIGSARTRSHPEAREGEFACLSVTDTGCGIAPATLRHIFDPFFTTKAPGKGTGLGLSTVYGIVKQHQGWVEVDSKPAKGTTFRVYLPVSGPPATPPAAEETEVPRKTTAVILLVEDDSTLRQLTRLLLEGLGHEIIEAGSGAEALDLWAGQKDKIQILFTDLVMPGLTGIELSKRLFQEQPQLKIILTSGYSVENLGQGLAGLDGAQFVKKPYATEILQRAIRECLNPAPIPSGP